MISSPSLSSTVLHRHFAAASDQVTALESCETLLGGSGGLSNWVNNSDNLMC